MCISIELVPTSHISDIAFVSTKTECLAGDIRAIARKCDDGSALETRIRNHSGEHQKLRSGIYVITTKHGVKYYYLFEKKRIYQGGGLKKVQ